ncbi:hypothetical protein SAMN05216569_0267 [Pseudoxanthomonas sp. CF125]|nr:hypothetical protein SAMN05216569_0267 [Pseudoxanthomonas sp. CF125]
MPLRSSNYEVVPLAVNPLVIFGGTQAQLGIVLAAQRAQNWCWAACAFMVEDRRERGGATGQCDHASVQLSQRCCISGPAGPNCDKGIPATKITALWHSLGFSAMQVNSSISAEALAGEIFNDGPVQCGITTGRSGHVVLVTGVNADATKFYVLDPAPVLYGMEGWVTADHLRDGLGQGRWSVTWMNIR